jgi:transposase
MYSGCTKITQIFFPARFFPFSPTSTNTTYHIKMPVIRRPSMIKPKGIHSTPRRRSRIYGRYVSGVTAKAVAVHEDVEPAHVYGVVRRYLFQDYGISRPGRGRPLALSERDKRAILREVNADPFISIQEIRRTCVPHVSRTTITRHLIKWGIKHRLAATRPFLTEQAAARRLEWAREHRDKPLAFWRRVCFSDETTTERGRGRERRWVFLPRGEFWTPNDNCE